MAYRNTNTLILLLLSLSSLVEHLSLAAPHLLNNHLKLVRNKRSAEVTYGNEQNEVREKRIDTSADSSIGSSSSSIDSSIGSSDEDSKEGSNGSDLVYAKGAMEVQGANSGPGLDEEYAAEYNPGNYEPLETRRRKRSADNKLVKSVPLIAENMLSLASSGGRSRAKRNLDYAQVQRLLNDAKMQNQNEDEEAEEEEMDNEGIIERLKENEGDEEAEEDAEKEENEEGWVKMEERLARHILALDAEKQKEERMLESMLKTDAEQENESKEARLIKRTSYEFSPYGGYWGSMVPGEKRAHSYERLYKLAQALNDDDQVNDEDEDADEEEAAEDVVDEDDK